MKKIIKLAGCVVFLLVSACSNPVEIVKTNNELPRIFPDYIGVTIPSNIAPLNFKLMDATNKVQAAIFEANSIKFEVRAKNGQFQIPELRWEKFSFQDKSSQGNCGPISGISSYRTRI